MVERRADGDLVVIPTKPPTKAPKREINPNTYRPPKRGNVQVWVSWLPEFIWWKSHPHRDPIDKNVMMLWIKIKIIIISHYWNNSVVSVELLLARCSWVASSVYCIV